MLANDRATMKLLKWLSKAIIAINWFSSGVQDGIINAEHINECKSIKHISYCMCHKTPEHGLKGSFDLYLSYLSLYLSLSWMDERKIIFGGTCLGSSLCLSIFKIGLNLKLSLEKYA